MIVDLPFSPFNPIGCCSVTQLCPTLRNPADCSTSGFPVLHHLPERAQTHVHWVSDVIQPPHPLSPPSPPAFSLSQDQSLPMSQLFASRGQSTGATTSASVFPMNIQLISFRIDWFDLLSVQGTLKSLLQHHSSKASFFHAQSFLLSNAHIHIWLLKKPQLSLYGPLSAK